jgi:hypothetical protein
MPSTPAHLSNYNWPSFTSHHCARIRLRYAVWHEFPTLYTCSHTSPKLCTRLFYYKASCYFLTVLIEWAKMFYPASVHGRAWLTCRICGLPIMNTVIHPYRNKIEGKINLKIMPWVSVCLIAHNFMTPTSPPHCATKEPAIANEVVPEGALITPLST